MFKHETYESFIPAYREAIELEQDYVIHQLHVSNLKFSAWFHQGIHPDQLLASRPNGRPLKVLGGKRRGIYVSAEHWELAKRVGEGNYSLGFARALDFYLKSFEEFERNQPEEAEEV